MSIVRKENNVSALYPGNAFKYDVRLLRMHPDFPVSRDTG